MKKRFNMFIAVAFSAIVSLSVLSCDSAEFCEEGEGELRLSIASVSRSGVKSMSEPPDTSDFLLTIINASGVPIYDGKYGDCPESLKVSSGSYTITVRSSEFPKPAFDSPQYGDSQCVVVEKDGAVNVGLVCRQLNSGVKLSISSDFLTSYPDGVLFLVAPDGKLMYSYSEKRIAFFNPGPVSLVLNRNETEEVLMTRELETKEILVLGINVSGSEPTQKSGVSVSVDTNRVWTSDTFVIGENVGGSSPETALSVSQARSQSPISGVWVSGYIVGGDLTSSSGTFEEPFKSKTNLILGPRSSTKDRNVCIAVQLPSGSLRDKLNLVDNPSMLGRKVCLYGDLVSDYFNLTGLKNLKDVTY